MDTNDILNKANRRTGMTVPEGYFADFAKRMAAELPPSPAEQPAAAPRRTVWMKIRPYVYMAAMFMGIWCMMKMFDMMRPSGTDLMPMNSPTLAAALTNDDFVNDYLVDEFDDEAFIDDMIASGITPTAFFHDDTPKTRDI